VPAAVRQALAAHAETEAPNEACGLILLSNGIAERYVPGRNAAASPYRFKDELAAFRISKDGQIEELELSR
jgi:proteasome lid subunit RPN8/RPN11